MMLGGLGSTGRTVCDSDQNGRILNSDQSGRSFRVLPFRRPKGVRRVSVLTDLRIGETAILVALDLPEAVQNYLMHMGFVPDAQVTALRQGSGRRSHRLCDRRNGDRASARDGRGHSRSQQLGNSHGRNRRRTEEDRCESEHSEQAEIHEYAGAAR